MILTDASSVDPRRDRGKQGAFVVETIFDRDEIQGIDPKGGELGATDNLGYAQRIREGSSFRSSEARCLSFIVRQKAKSQLTIEHLFFILPTKMTTVGFTYWQDAEFWIGYLDEFPDYMTQGTSLDDLREHLADLHKDLTSGLIPNVRRHAELKVG